MRTKKFEEVEENFIQLVENVLVSGVEIDAKLFVWLLVRLIYIQKKKIYSQLMSSHLVLSWFSCCWG